MSVSSCKFQRVSMTTQNLHVLTVGVARAAPAHGLTELFLIKYFALLYVSSNITLHDPF